MKKTVSRYEKIDAQSQALVYSQQVATGAKLAASLMVKKGLADTVIEIAVQEGCQSVIEIDNDWETVIIYKYPFVRFLLEEMKARQSLSEQPSLLDVWSAGKLFGYSDYEIGSYLQDQGYVRSAFTLESALKPNGHPCLGNFLESMAGQHSLCSE